VRDIDVYINHARLSDVGAKDSPFYQLYKYQVHMYEYYREFIKLYHEYENCYKFHPHTWATILRGSILLPKSREWLTDSSDKHPSKFDYGGSRASNANRIPHDRSTPIDFIHLRIITSHTVCAAETFKLTNRYGNKGVVPKIIEDEDSLVDEEGFVADCLLSPDSPINRLNPEQLAELDYNRLSVLVIKDTKHLPVPEAYRFLINYLTDFNSNYGKLMDQTFCNDQEAFVESCRTNGIPLNHPLTSSERTPETDWELFQKYKYRKARAKYNFEYQPGKKIEVNIEDPVAIGPMYMFLLNKDPLPSATELGYVNSHMQPTKIKGGGKALGCTPIKTGEQETYILTQAVEPEKLSRLYNTSGQNPTATKDMYVDIMESETPSAYQSFEMSDEEMSEGSVALKILQHIFMQAGVNITSESFFNDEE
jgi:hypothetical protein